MKQQHQGPLHWAPLQDEEEEFVFEKISIHQLLTEQGDPVIAIAVSGTAVAVLRCFGPSLREGATCSGSW